MPKSKDNDDFSEAVSSHANVAKAHKTPFHGDNTGSNPVGDAKQSKQNEQFAKDAQACPPSAGHDVVTIEKLYPGKHERRRVYERDGRPGFWISYVDEYGSGQTIEPALDFQLPS